MPDFVTFTRSGQSLRAKYPIILTRRDALTA